MFLLEDWCKHQNILGPSKIFVCVFLFVFVFVFAKTLWQWSKADVAWFLSNARPSASKGYLFVFPHFASEHTWFTKSFGCRHPGSNCKKKTDIQELRAFLFYLLALVSEHTWFTLSRGLRHNGWNWRKKMWNSRSNKVDLPSMLASKGCLFVSPQTNCL